MRGGGALGVRPKGQHDVTPQLLSEWTDPDTAMEAVGNSLGVFDHVPSPVLALREDTNIRTSLDGVLRRMVDGGALETRALADGRSAYRWRSDLGDVSPATAKGLVAAHAEPPSDRPAVAKPAPEPVVGFWARMGLQTAPLLLPAVSCVLVLVAFLWLDPTLAFLVTAVLAIAGVVGIVRRVQLATFWMIGLVIAGLLVRFS